MLLVSRGSAANIDTATRDIDSGRSQIRAFGITPGKIPAGGYVYTDGKVLGWGLRNSVGLGEHPTSGGIWSNENGSDMMRRDGRDIHEGGPGEEVNYHGTLGGPNGTAGAWWGRNYGYPDCAAAWEVQKMPRNEGLSVGRQFLLAGPSPDGVDDELCDRKYTPPRLTLPAHWAPIDLRFNSGGSVAYMTSRGSWCVMLMDVGGLIESAK